MTGRSAMLHVRIDEDTKTEATAALEAMGLSVSDAVRIFLKRVVAEQAFPLELKVPNARTRAAMAEADDMVAQKRVRFAAPEDLIAGLEEERAE